MKQIHNLLNYQNLKIIQDSELFQFSLDSVLLANFVTLNQKTKKILDIGTGNAPIPLILSKKTKAQITGIEIQEKSYALAKESVEYNHLQNQIDIIFKDVKEYYKEEESDQFDCIVCNPPFFRLKTTSRINDKEEKTIARHEKTLTLEEIFQISKKLLKNNGRIAIVHRVERLIDIICIMKQNNIEPKKVQFVYPKKDKEAKILSIEGTKNGNPGLKILPPIYAHEENGEYTKTILSYFQ